MRVLYVLTVVAIVALVSARRRPPPGKGKGRPKPVKKIKPVSENEALELFANIQKTSDSLKGELKTAALQVKGVISVVGTPALETKLTEMYKYFQNLDKEVFDCFVDTKMTVARSFIAGFKGEKNVCKNLNYEDIQTRAVDKQDKSIVCLLRSVFSLIDGVEEVEAEMMQEMINASTPPPMCDESTSTNVTYDARSKHTLFLFVKDIECMLKHLTSVCGQVATLKPDATSVKDYKKVRHAMLKVLVLVENAFKGHRQLIMPLFKSIKSSPVPAAEVTRALHLLETLFENYEL